MRASTFEEQFAFARVSRERCGALEFCTRLFEAAEFFEEIAAHAWQQVVALERRLGGQCINEFQTRCRTERHSHCHRAIQLDDRRWRELRERHRRARRCAPSPFPRSARAGVAGGDRGLQRVGAERAAELLGAFERGETTTNQKLIPERAILIEQQDGLS